MSGSLFWLSGDAWTAIEPHLPKNQPGARRVDDRRVISGIIHMLRCGGRWQDVPEAYGPATTNAYRPTPSRDGGLRIAVGGGQSSGPLARGLSTSSTGPRSKTREMANRLPRSLRESNS